MKAARGSSVTKKFLIFAALLVLSCGSGGELSRTEEVHVKETVGAKIVLMVIAPKDFQDEEFKAPYDSLTKSGIRVVIASTDTTPAEGMFGMIVTPDIVLEDASADEYDAVVVVGGSGCEMLWDNATLRELVQDFNSQNKTIGAMCIAPVVLGRAGILVDKIVTAYPAVRDEIGRCCVRCTDADVEISGNVITCSGPKAAPDFARAILTVVNQ